MRLLNSQKGSAVILFLLGIFVLSIIIVSGSYLFSYYNKGTVPEESISKEPIKKPNRGGWLNKAATFLSALSLLGLPDNPVQNNLPTPPPVEQNQSGEIGKGQAKISLAYPERTNLQDPVIKTRVDHDLQEVTLVVSKLPILGYPLVSLSAQDRYGYAFPAVDQGSVGRFHSAIPQLFLNMEEDRSFDREHLILHEVAGHYLSVRQDEYQKLKPYIDQVSADKAVSAEEKLISEIKRYKDAATNNPSLTDKIVQKIESNQSVSWEEIIDAANVYSADLWQNPKNYLQFRDELNIDWKKVEKRADSELYADFTAFLLLAQNRGLFDPGYQHSVLKIFKEVKGKRGS